MTLPGGVAVPIRVRRELWGSLLVVARPEEQVPADLEERLGTFADLVGPGDHEHGHERAVAVAGDE